MALLMGADPCIRVKVALTETGVPAGTGTEGEDTATDWNVGGVVGTGEGAGDKGRGKGRGEVLGEGFGEEGDTGEGTGLGLGLVVRGEGLDRGDSNGEEVLGEGGGAGETLGEGLGEGFGDDAGLGGDDEGLDWAWITNIVTLCSGTVVDITPAAVMVRSGRRVMVALADDKL